MSTCNHVSFTTIGKVNGNAIVLGSAPDLEDYILYGHKPWLVLDLYGKNFTPTRITADGISAELVPSVTKLKELAAFSYDRIHIDWQDGNIPTFSQEWWKELAHMIWEKKNAGPVFIHCMGGHGRTGVAAAILSHMFGFSEGKCPIAFVREKYCKNAVETKIQVWYVQMITETNFEVEDSQSTYVTQPTGNAWSGYSSNKQEPLWPPKETGSTNLTGKSKLTQINKEIYDELSWNSDLGAYIDNNGELIGVTFKEAVTTLKSRKLKGTT